MQAEANDEEGEAGEEEEADVNGEEADVRCRYSMLMQAGANSL